MEMKDLLARIRDAGPSHRTATVLRESINEKDRTVNLAFSSEEPYLRWFGLEILGHAAGEADLSFLAGGTAPFLDGHDSRRQIGVIEKAWIDADRKGRAVVRFSKNPAAQEVFQDIIDGIRKNISVGYEVEEMTLVEENAKEGNSYRVTRWTPLEASVVAIPADRTVGVGRSTTHKQPEKGKNIMETTEKTPSEINRINEITALAKDIKGAWKFREAAERAIVAGTSIEDFRKFVLEEMDKQRRESPVNPDPRIGHSWQREEEETPIMDAFDASIPERMGSKEATRARELSRHIQTVRDRGAAKGLYVPLTTRANQRGLVTNLGPDGGYLVGTQQGGIIDSLKNSALCLLLGATAIFDLSGDMDYPKITGDSTAYWLGEGDDSTESKPTFGQIRMTPKTVACRCGISRRMMLQTRGLAEQVIRENIAQQIGIALDAAIINGSGSANQPRGILQTTGIGSVTLNAANSPTWANIVAMETEVSTDNALGGSLAYLTTPVIAGAMKLTDKGTDTGQFVLGGDNSDGKLNGYKCAVSNNVPEKHILFGNWADVIVGFWSGMDILVDPYTNSAKGEIIVQVFLDVDVALRHAESFCKGYKA